MGRNSSWKTLGSMPNGLHVPRFPGLAGLVQEPGGRRSEGQGCSQKSRVSPRRRPWVATAGSSSSTSVAAARLCFSRNPCRAAPNPPAVMHSLLQPCWQVWPPRKDFPQPVLASQLSEMSVEAAVGEVGPCDNSHPCSICRFTSPVPATPL